MRVNHNISAMITQNALTKVQGKGDKAMQKLSTGLRINSAADDAAGMAISNKLRTQVKGLKMASRNSLDGISLVQTAEGALGEVQSMLQRMRELAIQASNDTMQSEDRAAIQAEVDQLLTEINDTSKKTEFNKIKLLNGDCARATASSNSSVVTATYTSALVEPGTISYTIEKAGTPAAVVSNGATITTSVNLDGNLAVDYSGKLTINGEIVTIERTDDRNTIITKMKDLFDRAGIDILVTGDPATSGWTDWLGPNNVGTSLLFVTKEAGANQKIDIACSNTDLLNALGFYEGQNTLDKGSDAVISNVKYNGKDVLPSAKGNEITITADAGQVIRLNINTSITTSVAGGKFIIATDAKGGPNGSMEVELAANNDITPGAAGTIDYATNNMSKAFTLKLLDFGPLIMHVGPNENMTLNIEIPTITADGLRISNINLRSREGAEAAIPMVDEALTRISDIRARLGAYQNRLEYTISNLDRTGENATASLARIEDTDMATEMTEYTQQNVLSQAGISILSQANQRPQQILQLLQ